jgi:hypothetical protein
MLCPVEVTVNKIVTSLVIDEVIINVVNTKLIIENVTINEVACDSLSI